MNRPIGPDVSFYQDDNNTPLGIDFQKMKSVGAEWVIIRAGQNLWEDSEFDISWRNSKGVLPRGSYWFYDSRIDPKRQAAKWISTFNDPKDMGEMGLWCDFEDAYGGPFHGWKHWYNFIEEVKRLAPGKLIGIYTGYYYWKEWTLGKSIPKASLEYFKQYLLWIANYGAVRPLVPEPWDVWTFWQYTSSGNGPIFGVESKEIDLNYFNGTSEELRKLFNLDDEPVIDPPEKASIRSAKVEIVMSDDSILKFQKV
jgi:lysozyme